MIKLGLSEEEHAKRRLGIGGSDVGKIMSGNWHEIWMIKTGRAPPKKIMSDWNYFWRISSEKIQLDWFEHKTGDRVIRRNDNAVCASYPFMRATLDGMVESTGEPINAKHLSGWTKEARQWAIDKYWWQIVHETIVLAPPSMCGLISLIVGEKEPEVIPIEADPVSIDELLSAEEEFWDFVCRDEPPDGRASVPPRPEEPTRIVVVNLENPQSNWERSIIDPVSDFVETAPAVDKSEKARARIKEILPDEVRLCKVGLVDLKRAKTGALTISLGRPKDAGR